MFAETYWLERMGRSYGKGPDTERRADQAATAATVNITAMNTWMRLSPLLSSADRDCHASSQPPTATTTEKAKATNNTPIRNSIESDIRRRPPSLFLEPVVPLEDNVECDRDQQH